MRAQARHLDGGTDPQTRPRERLQPRQRNSITAHCFTEQGTSDDEPLDLARALVDLGDLGVAVVALRRELLGVAVAAEDLDRLAGLAAGDRGGEELGLRALDAVRAAGLLQPRGAPHERAGGLDLGLHVGQLLLDRAQPGDRAAERVALLRVARGEVERGLRDADGLRGDPDPAAVERAQRDAHAAAGLAQALARGVLEREVGGRGGVQAHLLLLACDAEAVGAGADEEGGGLVAFARKDDERRGEGAVRDPLLGARDAVVHGARAHRPRVGARAGLGQRERGQLLPARQHGDVLGDLRLAAVVEDRQRARAGVDGDRHADACVGSRKLLQHEHVGQEVRARTAVLLGHADTHQPELAELGEQLAREMVLAVPRRRLRRDPLVREPPRELADLLLVLGQFMPTHGSTPGMPETRTVGPWPSLPDSSCAHHPPDGDAAQQRRGGGDAQLAAEALEAQRLPALVAGHACQLLVRVDGHGMPDEAEHRQVGLRIAVGVAGGEVDLLALGQLADRLRLALAVVERAALAAGVDAVDDLGDAADRAVEGQDDRQQLRHLLRGRGADEDRPARVLMLVGQLEHARVQARQDAGQHGRREPLQVAHMDALEQLPDALADGVRARVGRAAQAEDDVLVGVARDVAAGDHPGAVGRAAELERGRARDQRAVEVEERRAALAVATNGAATGRWRKDVRPLRHRSGRAVAVIMRFVTRAR